MKRFTVIFSILLVLCLAAPSRMWPPRRISCRRPPPCLPGKMRTRTPRSWDETMDDLLACLEEKGLISGERLTLASDGLCSLAVSESGAEFYWWDLDALDKDSAEYAAYESLKTEGSIDLFNSGSLISPASNGPFALLTTGYTGDVDALTDAFMAFGQSETEAG